MYHTSCRKSLPALILRILASFVNSKTIHQWPTTQREDTNCRTTSKATVRTETTRGPTNAMTRAKVATPWQKGFTCWCHCLRYHCSPLTVHLSCGPTSPMATSMSMSVRVQPHCRHVLQSTWCARPVCMQQPYRPGMTCMLDWRWWWWSLH